MEIFAYDGTFEGFLTVVFECYSRKTEPIDISRDNGFQKYLFANKVVIQTDQVKAERVWDSLGKKLTGKNRQMPFYAFLSEDPGIEMKVYRFIRRVFSSVFNIETDFGDGDVLRLTKLSWQVKREAMHMLQFVRFQRTGEGLYFCGIEPKFDVIPLTVSHFKNRYLNQQWLLYDLKRDYGIFYDGMEIQMVSIQKKVFNNLTGEVSHNLLNEEEAFYQGLWKTYFDNINIKERKNLKLQLQHMPRRFWKYLPEMQLKKQD
jgi:probable DNA metabolism protein